MQRSGHFRHNSHFTTEVCCWTAVGENIVAVRPVSAYATAVCRAPRAAAPASSPVYVDPRTVEGPGSDAAPRPDPQPDAEPHPDGEPVPEHALR